MEKGLKKGFRSTHTNAEAEIHTLQLHLPYPIAASPCAADLHTAASELHNQPGLLITAGRAGPTPPCSLSFINTHIYLSLQLLTSFIFYFSKVSVVGHVATATVHTWGQVGESVEFVSGKNKL